MAQALLFNHAVATKMQILVIYLRIKKYLVPAFPLEQKKRGRGLFFESIAGML
jgi:hypothetical protein